MRFNAATMLDFVDKPKLAVAALGVIGLAVAGSKIGNAPSQLNSVFGRHGPSISVHVAGHVRNPGLYQLDPQARIDDAVKAAGGPRDDADLDQLNLAQPLTDGMKLAVPAQGETAQPLLFTGGGQPPKSSPRSNPAGPVGKVSLNSASASELDSLPGVGPATSAKIIEYRNQHGGFKSVEEIQEVKGIGPKKFAQMAPYLAL